MTLKSKVIPCFPTLFSTLDFSLARPKVNPKQRTPTLSIVCLMAEAAHMERFSMEFMWSHLSSTQGQCLHEKWPWLHGLPKERGWAGHLLALCVHHRLDGGHGLIEVKSTPCSWWPTQSYRHGLIQVCLVFPGQVSERDIGHLGVVLLVYF